MMYLRILILSLMVAMSFGCGKGGSTVTLSFDHQSPEVLGFRSAVALSDPTDFEMKLVAVYLSEDIDPVDFSNLGNTSFIYMNPECEEDISHCDVSGGTAEDGTPMDKVITKYFDLSLPSEEVNTAVAAQSREVQTGIYRYVRLEFCKYNEEEANNIRWGDGVNEVEEESVNHCTVNSQIMDPPMNIVAGDSVTVTLGYSLADAVQTGEDAEGDFCRGSGSEKYCFLLPTFKPSANKP